MGDVGGIESLRLAEEERSNDRISAYRAGDGRIAELDVGGCAEPRF